MKWNKGENTCPIQRFQTSFTITVKNKSVRTCTEKTKKGKIVELFKISDGTPNMDFNNPVYSASHPLQILPSCMYSFDRLNEYISSNLPLTRNFIFYFQKKKRLVQKLILFIQYNKRTLNKPSIRIDTFISAAMSIIFTFVDVITFSFIDKFIAFATCALEGSWCV